MEEIRSLTFYDYIKTLISKRKFKVDKEINTNVKLARVISFEEMIRNSDEAYAKLVYKDGGRDIYCLVDDENDQVINIFNEEETYPLIRTDNRYKLLKGYAPEKLLQAPLVLDHSIRDISWDRMSVDTYKHIKDSYVRCKKKSYQKSKVF